jgi:hypothetical protein
MNNKQQSNLRGTISGSVPESEQPKSDSEADLQGFQKPQESKTKKKVLIGVISGLAVILLGAVVVLASGIWNPIWNPFQPSPDKVLAEAFQNMSNLKAVHSNIVYDMDVQSEESFSAKIVIESDSDAFDIENPKSQAVIDVSFPIEGMEMFFGGEIRSINEALYFNVGTIPIPISLELSKIGIDVNDWINKWFRFDSKELGMSLLKTLSDEEKLNMEQEIQQLFLEYPIAKVEERLANEKIEGQDSYHYLLAIDKENLKQFLIGLMEIVNKYYKIDDLPGMPKADQQEISDGIDELFEKTGGIDFEIWIGKKDKLIYKVAGQKDFDLSAIEQGEEGTLSLDLNMSFSKFNEPVEIMAPKDSQSIIEMLMPFIQMFMGGAMNIENQLPSYELLF